MNRLREVEDLPRKRDQLFVLPVLFLDGLPLLVGDRLTQRKIASSETIIVSKPYGYVDAESDPAAEPGDVDADERHPCAAPRSSGGVDLAFHHATPALTLPEPAQEAQGLAA